MEWNEVVSKKFIGKYKNFSKKRIIGFLQYLHLKFHIKYHYIDTFLPFVEYYKYFSGNINPILLQKNNTVKV